jgi:hypothetical protein
MHDVWSPSVNADDGRARARLPGAVRGGSGRRRMGETMRARWWRRRSACSNPGHRRAVGRGPRQAGAEGDGGAAATGSTAESLRATIGSAASEGGRRRGGGGAGAGDRRRRRHGQAAVRGAAGPAAPGRPLRQALAGADAVREHRGDSHIAACRRGRARPGADGDPVRGLGRLPRWASTAARGRGRGRPRGRRGPPVADGLIADGKITPEGTAFRDASRPPPTRGQDDLLAAVGRGPGVGGGADDDWVAALRRGPTRSRRTSASGPRADSQPV